MREYAVIFPFCPCCGGGFQEILMLSGPVAITLKSVGGLLGPAFKVFQ